jgi:hypothetical protein
MNGRAWLVCLLGAILPVGLHADERAEKARDYAAGRLYDTLFDTALPGQYKEGEWSLRLQPKFGDFLDDDYVRFLVGLRYNFSNYFDIRGDIGSYFMNPLGDGKGSGLYTFRLSTRYTWFEFPGPNNNLAVGIKMTFPISDPPPDLTDEYARYEPYLTISHHPTRHPNWLFYLNTAFEVVEVPPFRTDPETPHPRDQFYLRPGLIYYKGGHFRYSLELEYRTNTLHFRRKDSLPDGYTGPPSDAQRPANWILAYEPVHEIILYPGVTWFPTRKIRDGLWIPGNWDLGARIKIPVIEETGQDFGISVRFRWFYDYRKFIREDLPNLINGRSLR